MPHSSRPHSLVLAEGPTLFVGKDSEWSPTIETLGTIRDECTKKGSKDFGKCFADFMADAGAAEQAVVFARSIDGPGYAARVFKTGRVNLVYAHYPFRANENEGWLLVNGDPALIDVDSLSLLPKQQLESNPTYINLKKQFPGVMLFGGDRDITRPPEMIAQEAKGQRFIVSYRLLNGCHACEQVGGAKFAFDFDGQGKYLGSTLINVK